jgi:hypothetical protein
LVVMISSFFVQNLPILVGWHRYLNANRTK